MRLTAPNPECSVADEGHCEDRNRGPRHGCGTVLVENLTIRSTVSSNWSRRNGL